LYSRTSSDFGVSISWLCMYLSSFDIPGLPPYRTISFPYYSRSKTYH
jgi:hypothetical protein